MVSIYLIMEIEELREKQADFEGYRQNNQHHYKELEKLRGDFERRFSPAKIRNLSIDEYVEGRRINDKVNEDTFCYWVERKTIDLGWIIGARADKFGLYCNVKTQKYKYLKKFQNENEALESLKKEIIKLIQSGENNNLEEIKNVELSPMFKGKILFLYHPDKFLNIFSDEHLKWFLKKFGKLDETTENLDEVDKREILMQIKNIDKVMKSWTTYEFGDFLYRIIGRPPKKEKTPEELKPYIDFEVDYPNLSDINAEFIHLKIAPEKLISENRAFEYRSRHIDIEKENQRFKKLGEHGESVVLKMEKEFLIKNNKPDLAKKIEQVSKKNVSAGYDILSYDLDGKEKHIEVKSTNSSPSGTASFLISINEYTKAREIENYYIYMVFNAKSVSPKVWVIKDPISLEGKGLTLSPTSFRGTLNIKSL